MLGNSINLALGSVKNEKIQVVNRRGEKEPLNASRVQDRIETLAQNLFVSTDHITLRTLHGVCDNIKTSEIDNLSAEIAASLIVEHPDYDKLATRLVVSSLHKETDASFSKTMERLHNELREDGYFKGDYMVYVRENAERLDALVKHERDYDFNYVGIRTLLRSYLLKSNGKVLERPQYMFLRVAVDISLAANDIWSHIVSMYESMSQLKYTHATPTLFNAGAKMYGNLSSCFLVTMQSDSLEGIYGTLTECATLSKVAGGIGLHVSNIRAQGSRIIGTNGTSNGLIPMLRVFDASSKYVDQGGNKRQGSLAIYIEPWHADFLSVLNSLPEVGEESTRLRTLFAAVWMPDLFMKRVQKDEIWSFFCPDKLKKAGYDFQEVYGDVFEKQYEEAESKQLYNKQVRAREVFKTLIEVQMQRGFPYILYKDQSNRCSNHAQYGTLKGSNLCAEIMEVSRPNEPAVCNLASIALSQFVDVSTLTFRYEALAETVREVVRNLDYVITRNYYTLDGTKEMNQSSRPVGLGVQGLADVFMMMKLPFDSEGAKSVNKLIFETMYYAALQESLALVKNEGYETYLDFDESHLAQGILHFDHWDVVLSDRYDWETLRKDIKTYGIRNSLLIALMPTASTSLILGNTECFEPITSNIFVRGNNAGSFQVINKHLVADLTDLGLWTPEVRNAIMHEDGSIQNIRTIPKKLKDVYKTAWEISPRAVIDLARGRAPFVDQSQSMNIFVDKPNVNKLGAIHQYAWRQGLKTGSYYIRMRGAGQAIKFTVNERDAKKLIDKEEARVCSLKNGPDCMACSS